MNSYGHTTSLSWSRVHLIGFTYVAYWKLLVWPMAGLGPIHIFPTQQFADFTVATVVTDAAASAIILIGFYLLWKRKLLGGLIMGVTAALLPVLHVIPIEFEESIYHDRYAMTAVAIASALLPNVVAEWLARLGNRRLASYALLVGAGWLIAAVINIRVTVPLWSDEAKLWEWALRQNPGSIIAQDRLFGTYLDRHDLVRAEPLAEVLEETGRACASCMLKVASLAVTQGNAARATDALREVRRSVDANLVPQRLVGGYFLISGNLSRLQHDNAEAENFYREAIELNPLNPHGYMSLAMLLAEEGRVAGAREAVDVALSLYAPDEKDQRRLEFERFLVARLKGPDGSPVSPGNPR